MPRDGVPAPSTDRRRLVKRALRLSYESIIWGVASGSISIVIGVSNHSVAVLGVGLNLIGDMVGSVMVARRFRTERRALSDGQRAEQAAAAVIASVLVAAAIVLTVSAIAALASGSRPEGSPLAIVAAVANVVVLFPLGAAKRRVGVALASEALKGDAALSALGGGMALLALVGLLLDRGLGWWWADRVAALVVATIIVAEGIRIARQRDAPGARTAG
jgi:divalent metal cation (Fe/Co/Zn/Cd) transporter